MIPIQVVAAWPQRTVTVALEVPVGSTLAQGVELALAESPALAAAVGELSVVTWGVFGQPAQPAMLLKPGARVELYRPLQRDPREARRLLASQGLNVTHPD